MALPAEESGRFPETARCFKMLFLQREEVGKEELLAAAGEVVDGVRSATHPGDAVLGFACFPCCCCSGALLPALLLSWCHTIHPTLALNRHLPRAFYPVWNYLAF